jgi:tRNA dimethylallyltransferase
VVAFYLLVVAVDGLNKTRYPMGMFSDADLSKPVLLAGPTASGKSALALQFAKSFDAIIINADALQVYSEWSALTARPSHEDLLAAPHSLYGHILVRQDYSVGAWLADVKDVLARNQDRPKIIIGGTGLYFHALTEGLTEIPPVDATIRADLSKRLESNGLADLRDMLRELDPRSHSQIDVQNPKRVLRALEVITQTGIGIAEWQSNTPPPLVAFFSPNAYKVEVDKSLLNKRIELRFDLMLEGGALAECQRVMANWDPLRPGNRAIGAAELIAYLRGEISLDAARAQAIIQSQQYAKRQRTWLRSKMSDWRALAPL